MSEERACLAQLWRAVFGEPPPVCAEPEVLMAVLVRCLPQVLPYRPRAPADPDPGEPCLLAPPP